MRPMGCVTRQCGVGLVTYQSAYSGVEERHGRVEDVPDRVVVQILRHEEAHLVHGNTPREHVSLTSC